MTELESIIKGLIRSVKPDFSDIRFVNAYNTKPAEKPAQGYLALVEIKEVESRVNLNIRLMGGSEISGSQLGYTAVELAAVLKSNDADGSIYNVNLSETRYDKDTLSFYRDISMSLSVDSGLSSDYRLYIGSELFKGVITLKQEESRGAVSLYEFNRGEPYAVISGNSVYVITIEALDLPTGCSVSGFSLTVESGSQSFCYTNCVVKNILTAVNTNGQVVYTLKIISNRRTTV